MAQHEKVHQFAKPKPQFEVIQGRRWSEEWKDQACDLSMEELVYFQDQIRAITVLVNNIHERREAVNYCDIFEGLERQLNSSQLGHIGLASETNHVFQAVRILLNIARVLPTPENCEMVNGFYDRIIKRKAHLARPHLIPGKQQAAQS